MTNKKILLIGGGGHCKSVLDTILSHNDFSEIGIIEKTEKNNSDILSIPVIGCDHELEHLYNNGYKYAFITVGSIGDPKLRIKLFKIVRDMGFEIPNLIDQTACVSNYTKLGKGIFIGKNAVVNAGSVIDDCAIINTRSVVEHDCIIEEFVHIAPGAVLLGNVTVGRNTHIGANSVILQQLKIGSDTIIGMGSTVTKNIESKVVAYGNPCKVIKYIL
jgi:sugar O-acyltransferase (sialic acid O-acetyltransferase NeuD family)